MYIYTFSTNDFGSSEGARAPTVAQAKVSPSYTHLLASHEASIPSPAKVLDFIMQDSSSGEMCPTL